jgi:ParB-like chromosome segregation protein Spo0J
MGLPKEWNLSQIKDFQDYMDALLAGNLATRRHLRFVPGEFKYQETKSPPLKDVFDEYLARVICFTFAVAPDPFIEHVSRGAVEKSHTRALEEGLEPTQRYVKLALDRIIHEDFDSPDLEFKYVEDREQDPKSQMEIDAGYVRNGIFSIDEVRVSRGKNPIGGPASVPMLATNAGFIPLGTLTAPGSAVALADAGGHSARASQNLSSSSSGSGSGSSGSSAPQQQARSPEGAQGSSEGSQGREASKGYQGSSEGSDVAMNKSEVNPIAQKILEQVKAASAVTSRGESEGSDLNSDARSLIKALNVGNGDRSGSIDLDKAIPVSLAGCSEMMKTKVFNEAWRLVQAGDFKIDKKVIPISSIRATDSDVDEQKVIDHAKQYKEEGRYSLAPLVYEIMGKYYILDGHHRIEGAKLAGAESMVVANLRSTKILQVDLEVLTELLTGVVSVQRQTTAVTA